MAGEWLVFIGLMATVAAGVFIIVRGLKHRAQTLEMAHRERMAMIEKGMVPSPELNPGHAAWAAGRGPHVSLGPVLHDVHSSQRSLTLGIVIVAIGLGFISIIGVAGQSPEPAFGLGGAIVIVGLAFIVISLTKRMTPHQPPVMPAPPRPLPSERPSDRIEPSA
ncbi:MAG: DUF6249 domain-containing protein [Vicinamibacterales bacterium]